MTSPSPVLPSDEERDLVDQLTRAALTESLPEELGVFEGNRDFYLDARGTIPAPQRARDEATGFGLEVLVLLTPYVVAASLAAIQFVSGLLVESLGDAIKDEAKAPLSQLVRRLFHLAMPGPPESPTREERALTALPTDTVARVRDVVLDVCRQQGLGEQDAGLVSDAVAGRLAVAS